MFRMNKFITLLGVAIIIGVVASVALASKPISEHQIINEIHDMANTYIVADEIRNKQVMTQDRIDFLIEELNSTEEPTPNTPHLISILTRWKQGEFCVLASDHNYAWELLNGQIGYATDVKYNKLPDWSNHTK